MYLRGVTAAWPQPDVFVPMGSSALLYIFCACRQARKQVGWASLRDWARIQNVEEERGIAACAGALLLPPWGEKAGMRGARRKGKLSRILASSRVCPCGTPPSPRPSPPKGGEGALCGKRSCLAPSRSETHHGRSHKRRRVWIAPKTGFASLHPGYGPGRHAHG
jgi:hypothetical protein